LAEGRITKAEGRRQKAEGRRQKAEGRRQKAETWLASMFRMSEAGSSDFGFSLFCILHSALCILHSCFCLLPSAFCLLPSAFDTVRLRDDKSQKRTPVSGAAP
jgi:hypothetical protein